MCLTDSIKPTNKGWLVNCKCSNILFYGNLLNQKLRGFKVKTSSLLIHFRLLGLSDDTSSFSCNYFAVFIFENANESISKMPMTCTNKREGKWGRNVEAGPCLIQLFHIPDYQLKTFIFLFLLANLLWEFM